MHTHTCVTFCLGGLGALCTFLSSAQQTTLLPSVVVLEIWVFASDLDPRLQVFRILAQGLRFKAGAPCNQTYTPLLWPMGLQGLCYRAAGE